jgi:hypothetical protein
MNPIIRQMRFAALPAILLLTLATFFLGGVWLYLGGAMLIACWLLDLTGTDYSEPIGEGNRLFLDGALYSGVPLMLLLMLSFALFTASPDTLFAQMAALISIAHNRPWSVIAFVGAVFSVGLLGGTIVGAFGHELMHRANRAEWALGQVLLAHCLYTPFAIEHVYGHHTCVGTPVDHSSVARGRSFWSYLPVAIARTYRSAARFEAKRMRLRSLPWFAPTNRFLQGLILELLIVGGVFAGAGMGGLGAFLASAAIGILVIELSNYVAHYGLVRVLGQAVEPRHSWNAPRLVTTSLTLNLTRHADHHEDAGRRYWKLRVLGDAPIYPFGLGIMETIALVPPIWFRCVHPLLEDWDRRLASAEELELLHKLKSPGVV